MVRGGGVEVGVVLLKTEERWLQIWAAKAADSVPLTSLGSAIQT